MLLINNQYESRIPKALFIELIANDLLLCTFTLNGIKTISDIIFLKVRDKRTYNAKRIKQPAHLKWKKWCQNLAALQNQKQDG